MLFAIHFDGDLSLNEVCDVFRRAGYHVRSDGASRTVVSRVPRYLAKDEPVANVVNMPRAKVRK